METTANRYGSFTPKIYSSHSVTFWENFQIEAEALRPHQEYGDQTVPHFWEDNSLLLNWMQVALDTTYIVNSVSSDESQTAIHLREHVLDIRAGVTTQHGR